MKTLTLATLTLALGITSAQAASVEALQAILKNKEIQSMFTDIQSMREVANDRCPDCYTIEIHGSSQLGPSYAKALTERVSKNKIQVSIFERSR